MAGLQVINPRQFKKDKTYYIFLCFLSEKKLVQSMRSSGGRNADGVQSYTATVLYAAKSLGKGLRGLGETVASSLTGQSVSPVAVNNIGMDVNHAGVVTIIDLQAAKEEKEKNDSNIETIIAHFTAHSDAIVAMTFDTTGALLMIADKRGHDFNVFRVHPHPGGPTLAAVHHLYTLHRGDTTAKVQVNLQDFRVEKFVFSRTWILSLKNDPSLQSRDPL